MGSSDETRTGANPRGRLTATHWLTLIVMVALIAAMAMQLSAERGELAVLRRISVAVLAASVLFQLTAQLLWNGAMLLPLRSYAEGLGYWELFMVRTGGFVAGYVIPIANLGVRMAYLKRRGLGYTEVAWATALSNVLALFSGALVAVCGLAALWMVAGAPPAGVIGLTLAVLATGMVGLVALRYLPRGAGHGAFRRWPWAARFSGLTIEGAGNGWALLLLLLRHAFNFVTFGLLLRSLAPSAGAFLAGGLVYAITSPIRILTITPGNLGINEWVVAALGKALSIDLTVGLMVALLFRAASIVAQALGALVGGIWLGLRGRPRRERVNR